MKCDRIKLQKNAADMATLVAVSIAEMPQQYCGLQFQTRCRTKAVNLGVMLFDHLELVFHPLCTCTYSNVKNEKKKKKKKG